MTRARFRLGIDFGTSTTIAVLRRPDGRASQLLFDGSPLLASAVLLGPDGRLHTGRDAAHLARSSPERLEPNPKRRIDDTSVLLGDAEVDVRDLIAAVLRRVAAEAARVAGPLRAATLTHPANWGPGRRALLVDAAGLAGFTDVDLVPEPVAAATYLAATQDVPAGACVVVYDLGAGTCDVTVLRRRAGGFEPVASGGLNDLGGLDVDAAVVAFLQATYGTLWTDAATRLRLWDDVRTAKEMLSRASGTVVMVPALGREVPLGREQLEGLMRPVLRPSVAMTRALLADAGVLRSDIAGLFLVGGSSRIPLVATMLHEALGIAPVVSEQPELVVAEGALHLGADAPVRTEAVPLASFDAASGVLPSMPVSSGPLGGAPVSAVPAAVGPVSPAPSPGGPSSPDGPSSPGRLSPPGGRRSRAKLLTVTAAVVAALAGGAVLLTQLPGDGDDRAQGSVEPSAAAVRYDLTKMPGDLCAGIDPAPFAALYETAAEAPRSSRAIAATGSTASCTIVRLHKSGAGRATIGVEIRVTPQEGTAVADYKMRSADDAALNIQPAAVQGLGDEAVIFEETRSTTEVKTVMVLRIGIRDGNMTWLLRISFDRTDKAGWTAAQKQDLRDRLVTMTRTALPKVTPGIATTPR